MHSAESGASERRKFSLEYKRRYFMKIVLKFLAIFFSSLILAGIFGYWFGRAELFLTGGVLTGSLSFSSISNRIGTLIEGFPWAYLLFFGALSTILIHSLKKRTGLMVIGGIPIISFLYYVNTAQAFFGLLMLVVGYLLGSLLLFVKKKLFAKSK